MSKSGHDFVTETATYKVQRGIASVAAQVGFCLAWSETPEDTFCRVAAYL